MTSDRTVVLITGASSGIGQRTAALLSARGFHVFGTSRNPKAEMVDGVRMVALDVTDADSVRTCVETVLAEAGKIDVLVNNAGIELHGALEETDLDEAYALMETNFFGLIRVTQAVLPHMRERRTGKIIHVGSLAGTIGIPYQSAYAASKHAVRGLTDSMRFELEPFGIGVYVVQPNIFKSEIAARATEPANPIPAYDGPRDRMIHTFTYRIHNGPDSIAVAKRIWEVIDGRARHWLQPVGFQATFGELRFLFPRPMWDSIMRWTWYLVPQQGTLFNALMQLVYRYVFRRKDGTPPPDLPPLR
jgi:NAD(P)-dependent dehydrogenase (short-subunit alcohol dehydrogenase family)